MENQENEARRQKLKAIKNYRLGDNYKAVKASADERKERAKATVVTAYLTPVENLDEAGQSYQGSFTEAKKYNHKNKLAWGIQTMNEMTELVDDSEGGKLIKERIKDGIENSEEHIGCAIVKHFPGSGGVVEYRYTDIEFTESDRVIYQAQVAQDTIKLIDGLEEEFSKEPTQDTGEEVSTEIEE